MNFYRRESLLYFQDEKVHSAFAHGYKRRSATRFFKKKISTAKGGIVKWLNR